MDIKTRFDIGQEVFYMDNNRVYMGAIVRFTIGNTEEFVAKGSKPMEIYIVKGMLSELTKTANELFKTKDELLKSL